MKRAKVHKVTIAVHFDAPLTAREARHAVWNNLDNHVFYGDGKEQRHDERPIEPCGVAHVRTSKNRKVFKRDVPKQKAAPSDRDPNTIDMFERMQH